MCRKAARGSSFLISTLQHHHSRGIVWIPHIQINKPWLFFFILTIPILKTIIARSPVSCLEKPPSPKQFKSLEEKKKKKGLCLISKPKQDMRISTASHSPCCYYLTWECSWKNIVGQLYLCLSPALQRMLWCFCLFVCFLLERMLRLYFSDKLSQESATLDLLRVGGFAPMLS